jgi:CheY-like chemotaxis protein
MILLVEDNKVSREACAKILRLHGHEVMEAATASEGLEILGNLPVDLVITDFVMPDISGFQLIAQVRQKWPRMPILLLSGYLTPEVGDMVSDGVQFIPKPVDVTVLLQAIEQSEAPSRTGESSDSAIPVCKIGVG